MATDPGTNIVPTSNEITEIIEGEVIDSNDDLMEELDEIIETWGEHYGWK